VAIGQAQDRIWIGLAVCATLVILTLLLCGSPLLFLRPRFGAAEASVPRSKKR
jgi:hypothetical protein